MEDENMYSYNYDQTSFYPPSSGVYNYLACSPPPPPHSTSLTYQTVNYSIYDTEYVTRFNTYNTHNATMLDYGLHPSLPYPTYTCQTPATSPTMYGNWSQILPCESKNTRKKKRAAPVKKVSKKRKSDSEESEVKTTKRKISQENDREIVQSELQNDQMEVTTSEERGEVMVFMGDKLYVRFDYLSRKLEAQENAIKDLLASHQEIRREIMNISGTPLNNIPTPLRIEC